MAGSKTFLGFAWPRAVLLKLDSPQHKLQAPAQIALREALAAVSARGRAGAGPGGQLLG